MSALLVLAVFVPLGGLTLVLLTPPQRARTTGVITTGLVLLAAVAVTAGFDYGKASRMQAETNVRWASALDLRFHLGVDGISLPLFVLTALLTFLCALYSTRVMPSSGADAGARSHEGAPHSDLSSEGAPHRHGRGSGRNV